MSDCHSDLTDTHTTPIGDHRHRQIRFINLQECQINFRISSHPVCDVSAAVLQYRPQAAFAGNMKVRDNISACSPHNARPSAMTAVLHHYQAALDAFNHSRHDPGKMGRKFEFGVHIFT
jgi:hypothetical protein